MTTSWRKLALASATVGVILFTTSGVASAHSNTYEIKSDGQVYGRVTIANSHRSITICDAANDGYGVWVEFFYSRPGGDDQWKRISDTDGYGGGCGDWTTPTTYTISNFKGHVDFRNISTGWIAA